MQLMGGFGRGDPSTGTKMALTNALLRKAVITWTLASGTSGALGVLLVRLHTRLVRVAGTRNPLALE